MHKHRFCQKYFEKALPSSLHQKRKHCLARVVTGQHSYGAYLSTTEIGTYLPGKTSLKHKIKAADRLLGNKGIAGDAVDIQSTLFHYNFAH